MRAIYTILVIFVLIIFNAAHSSAINYSYTGENYTSILEDNTPPTGSYTLGMSVSGNFDSDTVFTLMPLTDISSNIVKYTFSDGRNTLTETNSSIDVFEIAVNGNGEIIEWNIEIEVPLVNPTTSGDQFIIINTVNAASLTTEDLGVISECTTDACDVFDRINDVAQTFSNPGQWSSALTVPTVNVPIPFWMSVILSLALLGFGVARIKKI